MNKWTARIMGLALTVCAAAVVGASGTDEQKPASAAGKFAGKTLNVALPPGHIANFERVYKPEFEKQTGAKIALTGARSADVLARVRIEKNNPGLDVVWVDIGEARLLGREGLLVKPTPAQVPSLKEIRESAALDFGIAPITFYSVIGFIYNKELVKEPPRAWKDLWEPRFKGKLALFDFGSTLGVWTLVIASQINGGSAVNIEPGFKAMQALKANAVGFRASGPENNNLVAQGEAAVTFGLISQVFDLQKKGAPVDWLIPEEGAIGSPQTFQVVANSPEPDLALAFLDYVLSADTQSRWANDMYYAVVNKNVKLDPKVAPYVPPDKFVPLDFTVIGEKRAEWTNRFNREILGR